MGGKEHNDEERSTAKEKTQHSDLKRKEELNRIRGTIESVHPERGPENKERGS